MGNNKATVILDVQAEISQVKQAAQQIEKLFGGLNLSASAQKSINSAFSELTKNVQNFEVAASKGINSLNDVGKVQKNLEKINDSFTKIKLIGKDLGTSDLEKFLPKEVIDRYKKLEDMLKKVKSLQSQDNSKAIQTATNKYNTQLASVNKLKGKVEGLQEANKELDKQKLGYTEKLKEAKEQVEMLSSEVEKLQQSHKRGTPKSTVLIGAQSDYDKAQNAVKSYEGELRELDSSYAKNNASLAKHMKELENESSTLSLLENRLQELNSNKIDTSAITKLREDLAKLQGTELEKIPTDLAGIKAELDKAITSSKNVEGIKEIFQQLGLSTEQAETTMSTLGIKMHEVGEQQAGLQKINSEMDTLKSRLTYFFSAMNGFQLFKNAIRDAYNSIKDLDKAMTETAVVTKMSVQDLWNEMPRYTKIANDLGTTTLGAYQAMTLYYQQGKYKI